MENKTYPRAFSHIGITVPDLDQAIKFYTEVMGWYLLMGPETVKEENESAIGIMCIDVFGEGWETFRIAHLSTSDGVGFEMFEFPNQPKTRGIFNPYQSGVFHFCVQDPDVEGLTEKIVAAGGKQRMPVRYYYPNEKPYRMVYVEDPFGNIFEIYSHSYELHYSSGAYK
ncbi:MULTISPECIES: lactoylglutathione lyase family protein [Persicobacter]|uniref:Glyoxalase family protein n=1 Tax=Persicobacter diffluens TaxID=981 RepID=A0AAN5AHS9_9BACT|nr:lactoylglutathione lyase family protein [Persicobacter sp. CCB-QB2]GJM59620.1 glyoxalase family protein [Persicobacter diffluens]